MAAAIFMTVVAVVAVVAVAAVARRGDEIEGGLMLQGAAQFVVGLEHFLEIGHCG